MTFWEGEMSSNLKISSPLMKLRCTKKFGTWYGTNESRKRKSIALGPVAQRRTQICHYQKTALVQEIFFYHLVSVCLVKFLLPSHLWIQSPANFHLRLCSTALLVFQRAQNEQHNKVVCSQNRHTEEWQFTEA